MSVLKLSRKVCIVEAWVEGGGETDARRARRGRGGSVEETVRLRWPRVVVVISEPQHISNTLATH